MSASANFGHTQPLAAVPPVAKSKLAKLGNVRPVLKTGVATAAVLLLAVPLMTLAADARGGGFGGGDAGLQHRPHVFEYSQFRFCDRRYRYKRLRVAEIC